MSKFENYDDVSKSYDQAREPVGADVIVGMLHVYGEKPLKELHVLDAGCGTGNYAVSLIKHGVGKLTLLDASEEMLNKARDKLKDAVKQNVVVDIVKAVMPSLPFEDNSFDVILFSTVLHHLDTTADGENFPVMEATLREANRVLRTNGTMFIADALSTAVTEVPWMSKLDKALTERYSKHFPNLEQYDAMLKRSSFKMVSKLTILGSELMKNYYDPEGPLKKEWRDGISAYALATDKEIHDLEMKVRKMNEDDTMMQFIKANDKTSQIGLITILTCLSQ